MTTRSRLGLVAAALMLAASAFADEPPPPAPVPPLSVEAQLAEMKAELARQRALIETLQPPALTVPPPTTVTPPPSLSAADERKPDLHVMQDVSEIPINRMLSSEVSWTGLGSFKYNIPRTGISPYVHGLARVGAIYDSQPDPAGLAVHEVVGAPFTFDASDIAAFIGAEFRDRAFVEFMLAFDHGTTFSLEFGQIDLRVYKDYLFVRAGKFRIPMGGLNVYPDPLFHYKLPELPLFARNVFPDAWAEVGVQVMGTYSWGEGHSFGYAAYVVNGLSQPDDPNLPGVSEGGQISTFSQGSIDLNAKKSFGGRLSLELMRGLNFGASAYTGAYTADGARRLTITDVDASFHRGPLTLKAEAALALQEITGGALDKYGGYVLAAYRASPHLEPALQFDWMKLDGAPNFDRVSPSAALIFYPYPRRAPTIMIKAAYTPSWDGAAQFAGHRFVMQVSAGF